jgi:hypothetical protein
MFVHRFGRAKAQFFGNVIVREIAMLPLAK